MNLRDLIATMEATNQGLIDLSLDDEKILLEAINNKIDDIKDIVDLLEAHAKIAKEKKDKWAKEQSSYEGQRKSLRSKTMEAMVKFQMPKVLGKFWQAKIVNKPCFEPHNPKATADDFEKFPHLIGVNYRWVNKDPTMVEYNKIVKAGLDGIVELDYFWDYDALNNAYNRDPKSVESIGRYELNPEVRFEPLRELKGKKKDEPNSKIAAITAAAATAIARTEVNGS